MMKIHEARLIVPSNWTTWACIVAFNTQYKKSLDDEFPPDTKFYSTILFAKRVSVILKRSVDHFVEHFEDHLCIIEKWNPVKVSRD